MIILKTIFITLLFFLFVIVLIRKCFVIVTIEHESMSPALHDGDRVLVFRYWPVKLLKRGDIILVWPWMDLIKFNREPKPFGIIPYIKRVVGLPGDTIVTCLNELDDYHQEKLRLTYDVKGEKTIINAFIIGAEKTAIASLCASARFLGITSPKISIASVKRPVMYPIKAFPSRSMVSRVDITDNDIFTRLLPARIAVRNFSGFFKSFLTSFPRLPLFSAIESI